VSAASLNGLPTLQFNGNAYLEGSQVLAQAAPKFSYYAVWQRNNAAQSGGVVFEQAGSGNGRRASLLTVGNQNFGFCGENNDALALSTFSPNIWKLSGLEFNGRPSDNIYLDDDAGVKVASINASTQQVGIEGIRVGGKVMGGGEYLDGDVAEILVFKRILTAAERYNVLYYLQSKWGVGDDYFAEPTDLATASFTVGNKPVDLHGATETYETLTLQDTAFVTNGLLNVTQTLNPLGVSTVESLTLGDDVTVEINGRPTVHVLGDLTLGENGNVHINLPPGKSLARLVLFTFDQLLGGENLEAWTISGMLPNCVTELTQENDTIVLRAFYPGTMIMVK
jgi:hypothetical protein